MRRSPLVPRSHRLEIISRISPWRYEQGRRDSLQLYPCAPLCVGTYGRRATESETFAERLSDLDPRAFVGVCETRISTAQCARWVSTGSHGPERSGRRSGPAMRPPPLAKPAPTSGQNPRDLLVCTNIARSLGNCIRKHLWWSYKQPEEAAWRLCTRRFGARWDRRRTT